MRYYLSENGGAMTVSGDPGPFGVTIPPGYRQVTEAEYLEATGSAVEPPPPPVADPEPQAAPAKARRAKGK
ncbi:hypothetical protein [Streptomyces griseus]|uniref:hypothetical protein n=1 Tax=Streptomyces griseus TaxID=1911 RepID=UPI000A388334|nr:hypothetical protein [Streptomyces fimicarius]